MLLPVPAAPVKNKLRPARTKSTTICWSGERDAGGNADDRLLNTALSLLSVIAAVAEAAAEEEEEDEDVTTAGDADDIDKFDADGGLVKVLNDVGLACGMMAVKALAFSFPGAILVRGRLLSTGMPMTGAKTPSGTN
jgi:hypothetical protein